MWRNFTNKQITTAFNMIISIFAAMFIGLFLRVLGLPCWLVCGSVAATAVVTEHFLTIYPLSILKYITLPEKLEDKKNEKSE